MKKPESIYTYDDADAFALRQQLRRKYMRCCLANGFSRLRAEPYRLLYFALWGIAVLLCWQLMFGGTLLVEYPGLLPFVVLLYIFLAGFATALFLITYGCPPHNRETTENLRRIGFYNSACEIPFLLGESHDPADPRVRILEFETFGLDLSAWTQNRLKIQSALNVIIAKIEAGTDLRHIRLYTLPGDTALPKSITWDWQQTSKKDFELILGESLMGSVKVNLNTTPHLLVAGATGSGKTSLLKCLLGQCIYKGADVYIADFKGGVDFNLMWQGSADTLTDLREVDDTVQMLLVELEHRKQLFRKVGAVSIQDYNECCRQEKPLRHIVFAVDEMAALTLANPTDKQSKERVKSILDGLAVLATQGRQFAIHLILSTQRPDRDVMPGQIKCNVDYAVCGRANQVLSQIILDSTAAADAIPQDVPGRFINKDGEEFQSYWFDDYMLRAPEQP
ncbi:MAG: DUF853 family protein [Faecalibacterium sp.]|jgi:S-DNA-T family DNA segregation ATPase FtsK/SpoIIIE|nr:DUF853 family protein [Faecalibacterium sp.]